MGLDMYLIAKDYIPFEDENIQESIKNIMKSDYRVKYLELEVGYWRKANQIHKWFVDNVQDGNDDCGTYYVSEKQLKELLQMVNNAITSKSPELVLPTTSGFFFGSTEYDEYYKQDLEQTKEIIEKYLALPDDTRKKYELYYHSSW